LLTVAGATTAAAALATALSSVVQAAANADESQINRPAAVPVALHVDGVDRTADDARRGLAAEGRPGRRRRKKSANSAWSGNFEAGSA
jgi:hypothetical protein